MRPVRLCVVLLAALWLLPGASLAAKPEVDPALSAAVEDLARPVPETARDKYRHPLQTLSFFGLQPNMTVVEIWPAPGYYSEILAPYLKDHGHYVAAGFVIGPKSAAERKLATEKYRARFSADPTRYGKVTFAEIGPPAAWQPVPAGSADLVLTFRNIHNWISGGFDQRMFNAMFQALKPGGILGVVEHRGWPGETASQIKQSGYVPEAYVKALAAKAGFRFVGASPVNDNPKDDHHHPRGVWTLPPTFALGDKGRAKYLAIGESDRMTLKFVRPRD